MSRPRSSTVILGAVLVLGVLAPTSAFAATIVVNTTADEYGSGGACSLREAIEAANQDTSFGGCPTGTGSDLISLPAGTYELSIPGDDDVNAMGDLDLDSTITIIGAGAPGTVVDGNGIDRVFHLDDGDTAAITDLTIRGGGVPPDGGGGGGILNAGILTLARVAILDNVAEYGGGIANYSSGAAPALTITDSLIANNRTTPTDGVAGGMSIEAGSAVSATNVTFSGNTGHDRGGAIWAEGGTATLNNLTITGNTADAAPDTEGGGGIRVEAGFGALTITNSIIAGNTDASGGDAPDCAGELTSGGHILIGTTAGCTYTSGSGDKVGQDPTLGPLADNGGPTQTHALLPGSPAIDAGDQATPGSGGTSCAATDQRGVSRNCDMGAYELVLCKGVPADLLGTEGNDNLTGTSGVDGFLAGGGNDTAAGGGGNDAICGGPGKDKLKGQGGRDKLLGEGGKDRLVGGPGKKDLCSGGPGKDKAKGSCEKEKSAA